MSNPVNDLDYSRTSAKHQAIVRAFTNGKSINQLIEDFNLTRRQIRRILKAAGKAQPTGRPKKLVDSNVAEIYLLVTRKVESIDSLASRLNVSASTIRRKVKQYERSRSINAERIAATGNRDETKS